MNNTDTKIGVYICHCGTNIAGTVDVASVAEFAQGLPSVEIARAYKYMCSDPGQDLIRDDIKNLGLNRVVVASCSPLMHERTFRQACESAGLNKYLFQMVNIREHCSWITEDHAKATEKAKALVSAAVMRVYHQEPLETRQVPVNPNTLVVGGGIAGIQAALEIAASGDKVYLVEREPSIGGHMSQLDKTFPTLDCSACILTPKMSDVGSQPNIELMTYSEVVDFSGFVGNFKAKIKRKARYVDEDKCTGCAECEKVCPVEVPSEFDLGLTNRKAIYRPFPQAVPNIFTIDNRGYPPCRAACPAGVNAQGYTALISQGKFKEAIEVLRRTMPFAGVCGRVCTHPCETDCERGKVDEPIAIRSLKRFMADYELKVGREKAAPAEKTKDNKVAIIGSGPAGLACAYDLVRQGYPVTVFEAAPQSGGLLRYGIPSYRLPNEIVDNEISYIEELGVDIKTNTPVKELDELFNQGYKAIFLATGAGTSVKMGIANEDARGVIQSLDFLEQANSGEKVDLGNRVAVIGGGNAAVDAARVAKRLGAKEVSIVYRRSRAEMPAIETEVDEAEQEGIKLHILAAPVEVLTENGQLTSIQCIRMELGEPDASGRRRPIPVKGSEFNMDVDNVIIAIGQRVDKTMLPEGLEYTGWGTLSVDPITLQTNIEGVFSGGDVVSGPADVIASIAAGKESAISIDRYLSGIDLKEGRPTTIKIVTEVSKEGVEIKARVAMPILELDKRGDFAEVELGFDEKTAIEEAKRCLNCGVCSDCMECAKACEANAINYEMEDEYQEVEVGNIIVATGFQQFDPTPIYQYGYGRLDNVVTGLEFERMINASGPTGGKVLLKDGSEPKTVGIIHCVGSRDTNYHEYCSGVCCMYSMKFGHLVRDHIPGAKAYEFYIDLRAVGKAFEEFYNRVLDEGTTFIRGRPSDVVKENGRLVVQCEDTLADCQRRIPVDMVVLSTALEPNSNVDDVARLFSLSRSADGFFLEKHPKLDPVATMSSGIFVVGCCQSPKDIPSTVAQASAAAARVLAMISAGTIEVEAAIACVDEELCSGCRICENLCPYTAISFDAEKKVCRVNEALCKGCGVCVAACPSGAIAGKHFTTEQIMAEIEGVLV
ncbi:MAG TPA: FAD-dependent oxidoreductase [Dehalococcoidia bacterium]|nr:FAD-dependent oxidoreductase [Dehalococcoidia bacterium]